MTEGKITISWQRNREDGTDVISTSYEGDSLSHIETQGILVGLLIGNHNIWATGEGVKDGTTSDSADESACDNG
mgnify:CR=1 FL=1